MRGVRPQCVERAGTTVHHSSSSRVIGGCQLYTSLVAEAAASTTQVLTNSGPLGRIASGGSHLAKEQHLSLKVMGHPYMS